MLEKRDLALNPAGDPAVLRRRITAAADGPALASVERALASQPDPSDMLCRLLAGRLHRAGEPARALNWVRRSLTICPEGPMRIEAIFAAIRLCRALGDRRGELEAVRAALAAAACCSLATGLARELSALLRPVDAAEADAFAARADAHRSRCDELARWDRHWAAAPLVPHWDHPGPPAAEFFLAGGRRKLWLPGCGATVDPLLFAHLGFDVWATDFSPIAIARLQIARRSPDHDAQCADLLRQREWPPDRRFDRPGTLHLVAHDFCLSFGEGEFDALYNPRAFQCLAPADMHAAARVFFAALRPGGFALFSTMNVQGQRRDDLEHALVDAGFVVPYIDEHRAYRRELADTGIDHLEILGHPRARTGDPRDQARLDALHAAHLDRCRARADAEQARCADPQARVANVGYSTG